jgi:hypothetical protein
MTDSGQTDKTSLGGSKQDKDERERGKIKLTKLKERSSADFAQVHAFLEIRK